MEVINQVKAQVEQLIESQKEMKAVNKYWRKHKTCKGCPGLSDHTAAAYDKRVADAPKIYKAGPFNGKELSKVNASAQRLLLQLQKAQDAFIDQMCANGKEGANVQA